MSGFLWLLMNSLMLLGLLICCYLFRVNNEFKLIEELTFSPILLLFYFIFKNYLFLN